MAFSKCENISMLMVHMVQISSFIDLNGGFSMRTTRSGCTDSKNVGFKPIRPLLWELRVFDEITIAKSHPNDTQGKIVQLLIGSVSHKMLFGKCL